MNWAARLNNNLEFPLSSNNNSIHIKIEPFAPMPGYVITESLILFYHLYQLDFYVRFVQLNYFDNNGLVI